LEWDALTLSLRLGAYTTLILVPLAVALGRWLAVGRRRGRGLIEAALALPLVLPPTVVGFYLLGAFSTGSLVGRAWREVFGHGLAFSFDGLLIASVIVNLPFAVQPAQRGFESIPPVLREAAASCGLSWWRAFARVELPLAWPGILTGAVLTFAHTLGEFGVVLMVGGNIPGETRTIAIAIYDRVQAFDSAAAGRMSALLLVISLSTIAAVFALSRRFERRHG
jgi:molybdate transport system permease protein